MFGVFLISLFISHNWYVEINMDTLQKYIAQITEKLNSEFFLSLLNQFSEWIRSNADTFSTAIVACGLVLLDNQIRGMVKRSLEPYNLIVRLLAFIFLFTFGYALLAGLGQPYVTKLLIAMNNYVLGPSVIGTLLIFGTILERQS